MRIIIVTIGALLVACGSDSGQDATQSGAAQTTAVAPVAEPMDASIDAAAPCEMLTEAMIREYLQPGEIEITGEAGDTSQSVYCQYKWYYELTEEEQQEMADERMAWSTARFEAKRKGEVEPPAPSFPSRDSSVFFNVLTPFDNAQLASTSFALMVQRLSDGMIIKSETLGEFEVHGGEMIMVEGVGDEAVWDPGDSQLSVLTGKQLFHLKLRLAGNVDSRADAERIAADLVRHF